MTEHVLLFLAILSPALFMLTAIASRFQPGFQPKQVITLSSISSIVGIVTIAFISIGLINTSLIQSELFGMYQIGFSIRIDRLTVVMLGMISLLGFIIVKFSMNYLGGDQKQGAFMGRLSATIASVQLLVLSGNLGLFFLAWVLTSISLHRLLVFYDERPRAHVAAKKKFILARLGDICLLIAFGSLYMQYGTGNLESIFTAIKSGTHYRLLEVAAFFLALAAILKSAQFPTHGWLIEVMETPTPVSALLHAGLLNAGPFLIIRMAFVVEASSITPVLLMIVGGFTALFASIAYLTQPSIKTALGYSSVGHMGFSLMVCGLGVFPAAMLHLVAHSFYKAHAFLSSGSVIETIKASKVTRMPKKVSIKNVTLAVISALFFYSIIALAWGINPESETGLLFIGAIIAMGLARIFASVLTTEWNVILVGQAVLMALLVTMSFFILESMIGNYLSSQLPVLRMLSLAKVITACAILFAFGLTVFIQLIFTERTLNPFAQKLAIHFRNGFYVNAVFDAIIDALSIHPQKGSSTTQNMGLHNPAPSLIGETEREKQPAHEII
jgi:NAD(P)H-quinone oxidoreductase subunit 5